MLVVVSVLLSLAVKVLLLQAFSIPSGSMESTLQVGNRILVDKVGASDVQRGEVVVFDGRREFAGVPEQKDYVKRVIAVAGDRVACCAAGRVTLQRAGSDTAVPLTEPYVFEDDGRPFCEVGQGAQCPDGAPGILVGEGRLWVMGDHRSRSADSRANRASGDGTIGTDQVVGRAFAVVWPPSRAAFVTRPSLR